MSVLARTSLSIVVASMVVLTSPPARAGGLVDTSTERFLAADFTDSEQITNTWWTLTEGSNFLYFAQDGDDCVWNLVEVLGETGPTFFGDYAGTNARIVLDRGWVDEDCEFGDDFQAFIDSDPEAEEVTYDWYAQDGDANIWYLGVRTRSTATSAALSSPAATAPKPAS